MATLLDQREREIIRDLFDWDDSRRRMEAIFAGFLLVAGALAIVWTAGFTAQNLDDRTVYWVTVPGFAAGLFLILNYIFWEKRNRERHRIVEVLRKLAGEM
jgi:hypothetical protein